MKSVPKLIRRFVGILMISSVLILILNLVLLFVVGMSQTASGSPYTTANEIGAALQRTGDGYVCDAALSERLEQGEFWALCIDDTTHQVVWSTENLPDEIPRQFSLADVSKLTLGYVKDYPTYAGEAEGGLVVLGYPKDRYWKSMWPTWDYYFIANLPKTVLCVLAVNILFIFLIYVIANAGLLRSVRPIVEGIQALPAGEAVCLREKGLLSELAASINRTSEILRSQRLQLRKKETARANWIAGVSHDIRTPLSMVMGYAGQLKEDPELTEEQRRRAAVIVRQSRRMKNLIDDLNLASRLEYNMQPNHLARENLISIVRQVVVDFMNLDIDGRYPIHWETDESLTVCPVNADKALLQRAVSNLIQNCINHNEQGCNIYVRLTAEDGKCCVAVADDGAGVTDEQLDKLKSAPHYMVCDSDNVEQRHGLGLLIVKQIMDSHGGETTVGHSEHGGFSVELSLPSGSQ
ncbi:MAG: HAMP domain-containing histidine kinase [Acetatifactor sp.]|nr:HAMP domain-containing histidine kinase [Acetatifactor sp.]